MKIKVTDQKGLKHELDAVEGWRVMEIVRDWGVSIKAECGGAAACATCHCYVADEWVDQLPEPSEEEEERLDDAFNVESNSRLSCQIIMSEELDGLEITLAPGTEAEDDAAKAA